MREDRLDDTRSAAKAHRAETGHDLALVSAAASNCAECDWSSSRADRLDDATLDEMLGAALIDSGLAEPHTLAGGKAAFLHQLAVRGLAVRSRATETAARALSDALRKLAEARRDYADNAPDDYRAFIGHEMMVMETIATVLDDPAQWRRVVDVYAPSWCWPELEPLLAVPDEHPVLAEVVTSLPEPMPAGWSILPATPVKTEPGTRVRVQVVEQIQ